MLDEFSKSLKASLYDRMVSPLFGAFLISWCLWNYRFVLVLFSSMKIDKKFTYIDQILYPHQFPYSLYEFFPLFVGPLLAAILFIILYPYPAKWVYRYARTRQKELKEIRQKIEDETPLTIEEAQKIRKNHLLAQMEFQKDLDQKESEITRLKKLVADGQEQYSALREGFSDIQARHEELIKANKAHSPEESIEKRLVNKLVNGKYRLMSTGGETAKTMEFIRGGKILAGRSTNDDRWQIVDNKIEFISSGGLVTARFEYIAEKNIFLHTEDADAPNHKGKILKPI